MAAIDELLVGDGPEAWSALGFRVDDGVSRIGSVAVRLDGPARGRGIVEWSLSGVAERDLDGLPTRTSSPAKGEPVDHPNGALGIDHVVVGTGDIERTVAAFEAAGLDLRRRADLGRGRMAFFRLGEVIVELVEGGDGPAVFWGLVVVVRDLDAVAASLGDRLGPVHGAVQRGRRIASLQGDGEVSPAFAFMSPRAATGGR